MKSLIPFLITASLFTSACSQYDDSIRLEVEQPTLPIITNKTTNSALKITYIKSNQEMSTLKKISLLVDGTIGVEDLEEIALFPSLANGLINSDSMLSKAVPVSKSVELNINLPLIKDTTTLWVSVRVKNQINLLNKVSVSHSRSETEKGFLLTNKPIITKELRLGVAVRKQKQDGIHTSRIPGLVKTQEGTLIGVFDARWNSSRDIQGDVDICIHRSFNGGVTWEPHQIVLDRGEWGGLPQKFNGIGDANIVVDQNTGSIFIAATWMYGIIDSNTGKFVEGLTEDSTQWSHEWFGKGSQPGFDVKKTAQFLLTQSKDDGETWSEPKNLTPQIKKKEWWLYAPAPGAGITMNNGNLVMPTQGRDEKGIPFSNFMYSVDHGENWIVANSPFYNTTECNIAELSDNELMLNMRDNRNAKKGTRENPNNEPSEARGRAVAITTDMGKNWEFHSTHQKALIEPLCMGCLYKFSYNADGEKREILLFSNPNSKEKRTNLTIKVSQDYGKNWPHEYWILLDEYQGRGYSSMTAVNDSVVGILYESSQADLVFQQIHIKDILSKKEISN